MVLPVSESGLATVACYSRHGCRDTLRAVPLALARPE